MIEFNNNSHGDQIAKQARCTFDPKRDIVISNLRGNELLGGVIYTEYTGTSIKIHVASFSKRWISRDGLWLVFDYAFNQLGVKKIIGVIRLSNLKAFDFNQHLGFNVETRIRDVFPDGDAVVMGMYRAQCRWLDLKPRNVQRRQHGR
jgi:RimJ/RimL family protein N-acetyltransferase